MSKQGMPLEAGDPTHVGQYEVLGRLGAGGMGVVYLARDADGRLVAAKVVHPWLAQNDEFRIRFRSEVARVRQVPPFSTAAVLDADPEAPQPYLVVEYVEGPTLAAEVKEKGPLTPANLHAVAAGIATALTVIHEAGVVHRDLKPANVLLAPGSPKVIDFGIARAMEEGDTHLTRTGQFIGTVSYMAPETFNENAGPLTPAADIFAWACVITFAGTGKAPYASDNTAATIARILTRPPTLDGLPDGPLKDLVARALATDPAQRPTARELLTHLLGAAPAPAPAASSLPAPLAAALRGPLPVPAPAALPATLPAAAPATPPAERPAGRRGRLAPVLIGAASVLALGLFGSAGVVAYRMVGDSSSSTGTAAAPLASPAAAPSSAPAQVPAPASAKPSAPAAKPAKKSAKPSASSRKPSAKPTTEAPAVKSDNQPPAKAKNVTRGSYGPYFITNFATGMCVDISGAGAGAMEQPALQDVCIKTADDNQEYAFVPHGTSAAGDQLYWIRNTDDDMCLDVPGAGTVAAGAAVMEMICLEADNQDYRLELRFTKDGRKYYRLVNAVSGLCLDVSGPGDGGSTEPLLLASCKSGDDHEWALVRKADW